MPIDPAAVSAFLDHDHIAVVGASDDPKNFGRTVYAALRDAGHDVVAVHPTATEVCGDPACRSIAELPADVDAAVIMVSGAPAVELIHECAQHGIGAVWLFKGLGGPGALSDAALEAAERHQVDVVPGACPLMFLEPTAWIHRAHRRLRVLSHAIA